MNPLDGVSTLRLPYDVGISVGRNYGVQHVTTEYTLLLDDDFVFCGGTDLESAVEWLRHHPDVDILGGQIIDLPHFYAIDCTSRTLFPTSAQATIPSGTLIDGQPVCDVVQNFFVARTDRLRLVPWDPALKKMEHTDFFTRAKGILTTVYYHQLKVLHARTPFDREYMRKRNDLAVEAAVLHRKWSREGSTEQLAGRQSASTEN